MHGRPRYGINFNHHQTRRKTIMNLPKLKDIGISEKVENIYAQIIAEEEIRESYGNKAIISEIELRQ
jgi:hypothetical protein